MIIVGAVGTLIANFINGSATPLIVVGIWVLWMAAFGFLVWTSTQERLTLPAERRRRS